MLKSFFDPSPPLLRPSHIVRTFTAKKEEELALPPRAIVTFDNGDMRRVMERRKTHPVKPWSRYRPVQRIEGSDTVVTRSYFGGPNIAALVEEFSAFGVEEFILWGYCGSLDPDFRLGNILMAEGALREDGTSYHYLEGEDDLVYSAWYDDWRETGHRHGFREALVWSSDAPYRETADKVRRYKERGITAVEMEVASFYSVCQYLGVKGIAFLVVSDLLHNGDWNGGFLAKEFKDGVKNLSDFMTERAVR